MTEPVVALYPADVTGCGSYRMIWPAEALNAQGANVLIWPPGHPNRLQATQRWGADGHRHVDRVVVPDADVLVFQRPLNWLFVEAMQALHSAGKRIVIELDDDFERVHPSNSAYHAVHPASSPRSNWQLLRRALEFADALVVSTGPLRRYARRNGIPCTVVENRVPSRYLDITHDPAPARLGWAGAIETHPHDLQVLGHSVSTALRRVPEAGTLQVVGPGDGVAAALGLTDEQVTATGWVPTVEYAEAVAAEITVGLAPLDDTQFNRAKSWLKPLEYAALGIPPLSSPLPEYQRLVDLGIGSSCRKPAHWAAGMIGLLDEPERRADEGGRCRDLVKTSGLVIEDQCDRWWEAWTAGL